MLGIFSGNLVARQTHYSRAALVCLGQMMSLVQQLLDVGRTTLQGGLKCKIHRHQRHAFHHAEIFDQNLKPPP